MASIKHHRTLLTLLDYGLTGGDEIEKQMLLQTGAELAASGCNHQALRFFGIEWTHRNNWRGSLARVRDLGLPLHTCPSPEDVALNDRVISDILGRAGDCHPKRLILAMDRTYLSSCTQMCSTSKGHCLTGGPHRPSNFDLPSEAQLVMKNPNGEVSEVVLKRNRPLANEMESMIVWDGSRPSSPTFDLGSFPVQYQAARDERFDNHAKEARYRGNWESLHLLGEVLSSANSVKHIVADGHGSHRWIRQWIMGQPVPLSDELKGLVPFFSTLQFEDLPICCFPIPARVCRKDGAAIHFWPGVAHSQKCFVEQLRSSVGTLHFGNRFADQSASLQLGLFPCAYAGVDEMSDRQAALWFFAC